MNPQEKPIFTKILLVDDDEASVYLSSTILHEMHAAEDIEVACDGYSASGLLRKGSWPEIILLDINMPKMDGFEFLEHLKKMGTSLKTKIIMLTTSARKEDKEKAFSYRNVLDYVEKPLTEEIVRKIAIAYCSLNLL